MSIWRCYRPEYGETIDDAKPVVAPEPSRAAIQYARARWDSGDPWHSLDVEMVAEDGETWHATVYVEVVPEFSASALRKAKP
jgi:hypothetical protein